MVMSVDSRRHSRVRIIPLGSRQSTKILQEKMLQNIHVNIIIYFPHITRPLGILQSKCDMEFTNKYIINNTIEFLFSIKETEELIKLFCAQKRWELHSYSQNNPAFHTWGASGGCPIALLRMAWEASSSLSPSSVTQISCRAQPARQQHL